MKAKTGERSAAHILLKYFVNIFYIHSAASPCTWSRNVNIQCGLLCSARLAYSATGERGRKTRPKQIERKRKLKVSVEKWSLIDVAHSSRYARYAQLDSGDATDMSENSWISFKGDFAQIEKSTLTVCGTEDTKPF